jgi:hypothetical protein
MREQMEKNYKEAQVRKKASYEKVIVTKDGDGARSVTYTLKIEGNGETAKIKVILKRRHEGSIVHGTGSVSHSYYDAKIKAKTLNDVYEAIDNGLELELDAWFTDGTATLTSEGNSGEIDFIRAGRAEATFNK